MRDCNGFARKAERHFIHVVRFWLRRNLDQEIVCPLLEHSALKFSKLGRDRQTQLFETILPHIDMGRFLDGESRTGRTVHGKFERSPKSKVSPAFQTGFRGTEPDHRFAR